jgi:hypothetical protein
LACDVQPAAAAEAGVVTAKSGGLTVELRGDRAAIIRYLAGLVGSCRPLLQIDVFVPTGKELAAQVSSAAGQPPSRASILGTVQDLTGASIPDALVRAVARGEPEAGSSVRTGMNGDFVLVEISDGSYRLSIESPGFRTTLSAEIQVQAGCTYAFGDPFRLSVGASGEVMVESRKPDARCRGAKAKAKR